MILVGEIQNNLSDLHISCWSSLAKTDCKTVSLPSCFSSTKMLSFNFLSSFSLCCLSYLHPREAHKRELLGTRTDVSLDSPVGTGMLCCKMKALTDLLFQTLCEVSIATLGESHPFFTYRTKKGESKIRSDQAPRKLAFKQRLNEHTAILTVTRSKQMKNSTNMIPCHYSKCVLIYQQILWIRWCEVLGQFLLEQFNKRLRGQ